MRPDEKPESSDSYRPNHWQDAVAAFILLAAIPFALGAYQLVWIWLLGYAALAGIGLTAYVWGRERRHHRPDADRLLFAGLTRVVLVFLIGGIFYIAAFLLF